MDERVSIKDEAETAGVIHDLAYRGKQVPIGHALAIAAMLNAQGMLAARATREGASHAGDDH